MALVLGKRTARVTGVLALDEVEPLAEWLRTVSRPAINLRRCEHLHTAALQLLVAAGAELSVAPEDEFLARWIAPLLGRDAGP